MTKCDFCAYYDPGFKGKSPNCTMFAGSHECKKAVERFSEAMKNIGSTQTYYDRYGNPMVTPFKKAPEITCESYEELLKRHCINP